MHALATNPAAVRNFRNRFPKPHFEMMSARFQTSVSGYIVELFLAMSEGLEAIFFLSFSFFLVGSVGDVSRVFIGLCFACLGHESCCCSRLSQPFSKAKFRDAFGAHLAIVEVFLAMSQGLEAIFFLSF